MEDKKKVILLIILIVAVVIFLMGFYVNRSFNVGALFRDKIPIQLKLTSAEKERLEDLMK
ncbi:MAG: hypothetical protein ABIL45_04335 [candidate division WOR-3 bacterium]